MEKKFSDPDDLKKPSTSTKEKNDHLPVAQVFLKIIAGQIEVKEDEAKFNKQIQDSELVVQTKYNIAYKTKPAAGSLMPQWHAGYTFAIRDLSTSIKLKLISTKRLINTTLGKVSIPLETIYDAPKVVELALEKIPKKLKSVKLITVMMCIRDDAQTFAKKYSVIRNMTGIWKRPFNHLNSPYFTAKGITKEHPSFKIVLERANYFAGGVVRGAIIFDITKTIEHVSHIKIAASCTESSIWTEGSGSNQVTYADARVRFATEKYLISTTDKDGVTLFAGMQVYPFELQLPSLLPSSLGYYGANMTYLISAECISLKNWRVNKSASAFFNVYGQETKFQPPLVLHNSAYFKKHLKDDWSGEVLLSSQKQYPNREYGMLIKFHNVDKEAVQNVKVSFKLLKVLRIQSKYVRESHSVWALMKEIVPMNNTTDEQVQLDFRYTLPVVPPTIAPIDDIELFQFHTIAKISVQLAGGKKRRRVVPITIGTIVPEDIAREPHAINPDLAAATLTVYAAKAPMVHGLVAYKSTSLQFFDEKIFSSYNSAQLVRIENVAEVIKEDVVYDKKHNTNSNNNTHNHSLNNNNNNTTSSFVVEEDRPMRNKYVDIDDDELPDSDESKSM